MAEQAAVFYRIEKGRMMPVTAREAAEGGPFVAYLDQEDLRAHAGWLGVDLSIVKELSTDLRRHRNGVDVFEEWTAGLVNILSLNDLDGDRDQLLFIVMKHKFLVVKLEDLDDSDRRLFESIVQRYQKNATLEKFIFGMLDSLLAGSGKLMEEMDHQMIRMEEQVVDGNVSKALNRTIYTMRHQLMLLQNFYEQLVDIGEELHANENDVLDARNLHWLRVFTSKAGRMASAAQLKSDNLVHLREALDAELNYTLNNIMKVFTVITAVFAPLTLIVGWYGMNFKHMPELNWRLAYPLVFIGSVLLTAVILWWFKRKKLM